MNNQQGPAVQHRDLCSMLFGSLDGRGVWGRMDSCTCIPESLHCAPETITTVLIGYTPVQNKVLKRFLKCLKKKRNDEINQVKSVSKAKRNEKSCL